ncbi:MAG: sulfate adenylyltransferase [Candidatus Saganbacteria bacterium]|nr:sulfate adenylyltransferase [Candidatus Saganbacteria bacterium]
MLKPHGGKLISRTMERKEKGERGKEINDLPIIKLNSELVQDVVNIANGVYSPLEGFLNFKEFLSVLDNKRLPNGLAWTIPIVLDVPGDVASKLKEGNDILLVDSINEPIAVMHLEEKYGYSKEDYMTKVYGTIDPKHPGAVKVQNMKNVLLSGKIDLINEPKSPFPKYSFKPSETRKLFAEKGWETVVGFQTRNVSHLGHEYVQKTALSLVDGLFINPVIGKKKKGDFKDEVIIETYEALIDNYYLKDRTFMGILEMEMRYAGPREAIFHAIIRKNFGCTHFIVGRDHAGVGSFYPPYAAQEIFSEFPDIEIEPIFFKSFFYCRKCGGVANEKTCPHDGENIIDFSGTKIREMLLEKKIPPAELMREEVAEVIIRHGDPFVN